MRKNATGGISILYVVILLFPIFMTWFKFPLALFLLLFLTFPSLSFSLSLSLRPFFSPSFSPPPFLPWMCAAACGVVGKSRWRRSLNEKECNGCDSSSTLHLFILLFPIFMAWISLLPLFPLLFLTFPLLSHSRPHSPSFTLYFFLSLSLIV